jgi:hypothetical protein
MDTELKRLYEADVFEHAQGNIFGTPEYWAMRERADELIAAGRLQAPEDFFHAARIFQHGDAPAEAKKAHLLARTAAERGYRPARWLAAAAYDRWQMYQGLPQKYGTQYVSDGKRQRLWEVDPSTTDEERAAWDVPPLEEQLRKAEEATRLHPQTPVPDDAPAWLKDALRRWQAAEAKEGEETN